MRSLPRNGRATQVFWHSRLALLQQPDMNVKLPSCSLHSASIARIRLTSPTVSTLYHPCNGLIKMWHMCSTNTKSLLSGLCFVFFTNSLIHLFYIQNANFVRFYLIILYFILHKKQSNWSENNGFFLSEFWTMLPIPPLYYIHQFDSWEDDLKWLVEKWRKKKLAPRSSGRRDPVDKLSYLRFIELLPLSWLSSPPTSTPFLPPSSL